MLVCVDKIQNSTHLPFNAKLNAPSIKVDAFLSRMLAVDDGEALIPPFFGLSV